VFSHSKTNINNNILNQQNQINNKKNLSVLNCRRKNRVISPKLTAYPCPDSPRSPISLPLPSITRNEPVPPLLSPLSPSSPTPVVLKSSKLQKPKYHSKNLSGGTSIEESPTKGNLDVRRQSNGGGDNDGIKSDKGDNIATLSQSITQKK
jgi:hypothetical protein